MNFSLATQAPVPKNERNRIIELSELDIDYAEFFQPLEELSKLAAMVAGTSVSLVNLIDTYTQWTVSSFGLAIKQMSREESVCQYTIAQDESFEIQDLSRDERFKDQFYVTGTSGLRYYFGIPLQTPSGSNIGALCFLDKNSRKIDPEKAKLLKIIADEIVSRLMLQRTIDGLKDRIGSFEQTHKRVAHDIRGPLGGILGLTDIIIETGTDGNLQEVLDLIQMIRKSSKGLLELADEILLSTTNVAEPKGSLTLGIFKEKLEKLFTPQCVSKKLDFQVTIQNGKQDLVISRKSLLQIVGNLISNAIKFTPEQGSVRVELDFVMGHPPLLEISVKDTGLGLSDIEIEEIMRGESSSRDGTEGEKGYGFGLHLVQRLAAGLNGIIQIESEIGHGTCFKISLPQAE